MDPSVHSNNDNQDGDAFLVSQQLYDELLATVPSDALLDPSISPASLPSSPSWHASSSSMNPRSPVSRGTNELATIRKLSLALFIVLICYALSRQDVLDAILVRFQQPIEKACTAIEDRIAYLFHDPVLPNMPPCIPKLCPDTLSFLSHPDPYAVLGLRHPPFGPTRPAPTRLDIGRALRARVFIYHPDKSQRYLEPDKATYVTGIYTKAARTLLEDLGNGTFAWQWFSDQGKKHLEDYLRERSYQEFGPVDKWTVIREIRVGDIRWLLRDL
ncbi:MAG: hypothetical protein Q9208_008136 [Pyrenodesmia sp. 3 TL-2023]